jgi:hypothetical protein
MVGQQADGISSSYLQTFGPEQHAVHVHIISYL